MAGLVDAKLVLVFSSHRILVGVISSNNQAAKMVGVTSSSISSACNGESNSSAGFLWRYMDEDIEIEFSDVGTLRIEEYDEAVGNKRKYIAPKDIKNRRKK